MRSGIGLKWGGSWVGGIVSVGLFLTACGSKALSSVAADSGSSEVSSDTGINEVLSGDVPGHDAAEVDLKQIETKAITTPIQVKQDGQDFESALVGMFVHPLDCTKDKPCPLVIVVGDYDPPPLPTYADPVKKMAAVAHVNAIVFNPPGVGEGTNHSTGTNDFGALWAVATVKQLLKLYSVDAAVDKTQVGFLTIGTGIIPVAAGFATYPTNFKDVAFVIDVEGPVDRCAISQAPADPSKNIGPGDGAGLSDSACHFNTPGASHSAQYPAAQDGKPASIVCAPGAWPITQSGSGCDDNSWWVEREPYAHMQKIAARYQRIQFQYDHRLPSHWSSRLAMKTMASSPSNFFVLNNMPGCSTLSDDQCATLSGDQSCWLSGDWGNGLPPAPYAGADFRPISWDSLFSEVLPDFVSRVVDTKGFPKCK